MTTFSGATDSHFLIARASDAETNEVWLARYNSELCNENIVLRNCLKTKQRQQQETANEHGAEVSALKQEMEQLKDEAARARISNMRLMREAATLREQFGYD